MFDLDQLSRNEGFRPEKMAYLFDQTNAALLQRISEMAPETNDWLLVDARDSRLVLPGSVNHLDLLEPGGLQAMEVLGEEQFDGLVINLQLAWLDPFEMLPRLLSKLRAGCSLFFVSFGPDTLFELREGWETVDDRPHVHPFIDMHHLGDTLVRLGMKKPIVDSDWVGVQYEDVDLLMQDLKSAGLRNILSERRKTLTGKGRLAALRRRMAPDDGAPLGVTWEIVYGYAVKSAPSTGSGIRVTLDG